jgi:hypothetical protein
MCGCGWEALRDAILHTVSGEHEGGVIVELVEQTWCEVWPAVTRVRLEFGVRLRRDIPDTEKNKAGPGAWVGSIVFLYICRGIRPQL